MRELNRAGDAEGREPRQVLRGEQLSMLDPRAEAFRRPQLVRLLECVERLAVGAVADRVDRDREAGGGAPADDVGQLGAARDSHAAAVEHPGGLRAERPVHEHLEVAELEVGATEPGAQSEGRRVVEQVVRDRLPDAQGQLPALLELPPEP